jgi:hypothetical protein
VRGAAQNPCAAFAEDLMIESRPSSAISLVVATIALVVVSATRTPDVGAQIFTPPSTCGKAYYDLVTIENRTLEIWQDTVKK